MNSRTAQVNRMSNTDKFIEPPFRDRCGIDDIAVVPLRYARDDRR